MTILLLLNFLLFYSDLRKVLAHFNQVSDYYRCRLQSMTQVASSHDGRSDIEGPALYGQTCGLL